MNTHKRFFTLALCFGIAASCGLAQTKANNDSLTVGILPFADVSGNSDIGPLATTLPSLLQSALLNQSKLIPRQVNSGGLVPGTGQALDAATAAQQGAGNDIVLVGQILSGDVQTKQESFSGPSLGGFSIKAAGNSQKSTIVLQVDVIDVNRAAKLASLRVTGHASENHIDPNVDTNYGSMDMSSASFQNTSLGKATHQALNDLVKQLTGATSRFVKAAPTEQAAAVAVPGNANSPLAASAPSSVPATPVPSTGSAGNCHVIFRAILASEMKPLDGFKVLVNKNDLSPLLNNGILRIDNPPQQLTLDVTFAKSPLNPLQPLTASSQLLACGCDKTEKILVLLIDSQGNGNFTWLQ